MADIENNMNNTTTADEPVVTAPHHDDTVGEETLDPHTDPFTPRVGKTLVWKNVNMKLTGEGEEKDRLLLQDVWGEVPNKETTAIMGPSGAGKTSLLNILAGRARSRGRIAIDADVRLNNYSVDPTDIAVRKHIAFVAQDDSLQVTATPREAIRFSAKLRLRRGTSESQLDKLTSRMLAELGLESCADTKIGSALKKGISGGERKRTSIGVELVVKPTLLFLDEPTSGLDSFSAVQVCEVLKKVANAGASVLFTIHQPSSEIFSSFDRLILLNRGRVMYQGPVQGVPDYFAERGYPSPPNYNPADWIMNVAQSFGNETLEKAGFFPSDDRVIEAPFDKEDGKDILGLTLTRRPMIGSQDLQHLPPGILIQTRMLFTREFLNIRRDVAAMVARIGFTMFLSLLIGVIFLNVGKTSAAVPLNLQSHFGALVVLPLMAMFGTAQPALLSFPAERPVFLREYSTNHYSVLSYFTARLTVEAVLTAMQVFVLCIITYFMIGLQANFGLFYLAIYALAMASTALAVMLGCSVEDPKLGHEMVPLLFVPQMLFSGFFVAPSLIPSWLRWARYLCTLMYAIRILLVEEFDNCGGDSGSELAESENQACSDLLINSDAIPDETWWNWLVLVGLFVVFRLFAVSLLRSKANKFY